MGPVLLKKMHHGTQYSLRALPVGGFVALEGEESPESQQAEGEERSDLEERPLSQRSGAASSPNGGALNGEELSQPTGKPLNEAPVWQRALIMAAGACMNFLLGFVVMAILLTAQNEPITSRVIYAVEDGALCGQTGLEAGDKVLAVNGRRCFVANDMLYELMRTESYRADFTVRRDGKLVELPDVQFDTWQDAQGQTHIVFTSLIDLLRGRESINDLSGPVGIVTAIGQAASYGWEDVAELLALITINLGVLNLLPFPALDGGKIVFLLIEAVTGHAVPEKLQSVLTLATFGLLFGLMIFATYNDILRLITGTV